LEVKVLGDNVLTIVCDEDMTNIEFDVVVLLLGLKEIEGGTIIQCPLMVKGNKIKHDILFESV
jgi:hypothetical protein